MPTIFDWLARLEFMRGLPAVYLALVMAMIIIVINDWRVMVLALAVQYLAVDLLFVDVLDPRLAVVKLLVGWFICLILYVTARQVNYGRLPEDVSAEEVAQLGRRSGVRLGWRLQPTSLPLRLFLTLMMALAAWSLAQRPSFQLPAIPEPLGYFNLAVFGLLGLGLLGLGLTTEPLQGGISLLLLLTGFELYYSVLEQSVAMLAALAAVNFVLALAIAYLTQARHALPDLVD